MMHELPGAEPLRALRRALPALLAATVLAWSAGASAQSAAQRAVDAAKPLCAGGKTITICLLYTSPSPRD